MYSCQLLLVCNIVSTADTHKTCECFWESLKRSQCLRNHQKLDSCFFEIVLQSSFFEMVGIKNIKYRSYFQFLSFLVRNSKFSIQLIRFCNFCTNISS